MNIPAFLFLACAALLVALTAGQRNRLQYLLWRRQGYNPYYYYYPNYYAKGQGQGSTAPPGGPTTTPPASESKDGSKDSDGPESSKEDKSPESSKEDKSPESSKEDKGPKSSKEDKSPESSKEDKGLKSPKKEKSPESPAAPKQPESLCPPEPTMRSLNSKPVKSKGGECNFEEVASITSLNGQTVACNAALTKAKVDGVMKTTFVTSALCATMVDELLGNPESGLELRLGSHTMSLEKPFETKLGPDGVAFLDLPEGSPLLAGLAKCEKPSCAYNPSTMKDKVDMSDCKMISYGATDAVDLKFEGKHETSLKEKPFGCSEIPDLFGAANTKCMESEDGKDVFCIGDNGAPTFCKAPSTGEWILVGVAATQTVCGGSSEIKVIPVPT